MLLRDEQEQDLAEIERDLRVEAQSEGQTFTWRGKAVPCSPSGLGKTIEIDARGNAIAVSLRLVVRRSHFLTADSTLVTVDSQLFTADNDMLTPVSGYSLAFRGRQYQVITARESANQSYFCLTLADNFENADPDPS